MSSCTLRWVSNNCTHVFQQLSVSLRLLIEFRPEGEKHVINPFGALRYKLTRSPRLAYLVRAALSLQAETTTSSTSL